jgi:hypothetical protein
MADAPFDQTNIGLRERPSSGDLNQVQSQIFRTIRELARVLLSPRTSNTSSAIGPLSGMIADGFRVLPSSPAAMTVVVTPGIGFRHDPVDVVSNLGIPDLEQVNDLSPFKPLSLLAPVTFPVPAAPAGPNSRIDIVEVRTDRRLTNAIPRRQLDTGTVSFLDHVFFKTLSYGQDGDTGIVASPAASTAGLSYKVGTAANPGLVPATTAGYVKLAEILVSSSTTSITGLNIVDRRVVLSANGMTTVSVRFRVQWNGGAGAQTATILDCVSPPGFDVAVAPVIGGQRGDFNLFITGGQILRVTQQLSVNVKDNLGASLGSGETLYVNQIDTGVQAVDSSQQTAMAAAGISCGIGTSYVQVFNANGRLSLRNAAGAASTTDAKLENVVFNATVQLSY